MLYHLLELSAQVAIAIMAFFTARKLYLIALPIIVSFLCNDVDAQSTYDLHTVSLSNPPDTILMRRGTDSLFKKNWATGLYDFVGRTNPIRFNPWTLMVALPAVFSDTAAMAAKVNAAGARSSISITTTGTSGAATYNNTTGVFNIPQYGSSAVGNDKYSAYSAGTVYSITTTSQKIDFGTTDPVITITNAGTYTITINVQLGYNLATVLTSRNITIKVRRTNNTAADVSPQNASFQVPLIGTALTGTAGDCDVASFDYTASAGDVLELWISIDAGISTGSVQVTSASIKANRIY